MSEKSRTMLYEQIGQVQCSPPALEYKDEQCQGEAKFVCHHCKSPICAKCVKIGPDEDFPVFLETEKTGGVRFYVSIAGRMTIAALLFPIILLARDVLGNVLGITEFSLENFFYTDFQKMGVSFENFHLSINVVGIISVLAILSAVSIMCITYVRSEEDTSGRRSLKIYEKKNLSAAHCRYCWQKYHKSRLGILRTWIPIVLYSVAITSLIIGLVNWMVDFTLPLILVLFAKTSRKIAKCRGVTPVF